MTKKALLVVDIQTGTLVPLIGKEDFLANVNDLIDFFHKENLPVVFVRKFGYGKLSEKLHRNKQDVVVSKIQMNTFCAPEFKSFLLNSDLESFVVVGLMSHACIQSTCKGAIANNYSIVLVEDAHDSIIKPMRSIWNKKLKKLGVKTITTKEYLKS